ncbi:MAG: coproporphyrinogen III oxidase [Acidimicrobiia bacterium]|nr:coproporphyrinogen III oxidase [Acidimicrobiia bacterium]
MTSRAHEGLAVYVHWPYCLANCPYCDFNSHVAEAVPEGRWRDAVVRELAHYHAETGRLGHARTIFFGGGTPSLMSPESAGAIVHAVKRLWGLADHAEITLEANPTSVEAKKFEGFRRAGINRVSIGVQALDDEALRFLGRKHSAAEALRALETAAAIFPRFSFDLIYARPGQTVAGWRRELGRALRFARGHLSLYQLTIEPGTLFHRDRVLAADEDAAADLFEATQEMTRAAGLHPYEISNHAKPGAECRHNLIYWRGGCYVGVGPGAHGRMASSDGTAVATHQIHDPAGWLAAVEKVGHGTGKRQRLTPEKRREELLLASLRLSEGVGRARFRAQTGTDVLAVVDRAALMRLTDGGFLECDEHRLRATAAGRQRLNAILASLLPAR